MYRPARKIPAQKGTWAGGIDALESILGSINVLAAPKMPLAMDIPPQNHFVPSHINNRYIIVIFALLRFKTFV